MRLVRHAFLVGITAFTLMAQAAERPESMVKMVVRVTGPGLRPNSFSSLPKTIYRAGSYYARIEDPPDSKQQIQKLIIIVEPDAYSVNLADKKGTHALEQGGPNDLHLSIALPFDPKRELGAFDQLEFGDEVGFFQGASAKKEIGPEIGKSPTDVFRLKIPSGIASLFLRRGTQIPMLLTWEAKDGKYKYEYLEYKELPFDPALFVKPAGIAYREITPDTTARD